MEVIEGKISDYNERGQLVVTAEYVNAERLVKRRYGSVLIGLRDGRRITPEQRRKAYALMGEIAEYVGETPETEKDILKQKYRKQHWDELAGEDFSLSDCDVTTASEFIGMLVELVLDWGVPLRVPLYELCDGIWKYLRLCLERKICCVCGKAGELHHMDAIGMGNDRRETAQQGRECMCLCRVHHTEYHTIGRAAFLGKYHFDGGVKLDEKLCKVYRVKP